MFRSLNADFDMTHFVVEIAKFYRPETYLELGIYKGETIRGIVPHVDTAIGVDISDVPKTDSFTFYKMTTDIFFEKIKSGEIDMPKLDLVFIDAEHSCSQVLKDFNNVFEYVHDQGLIFMHDTFPQSKEFTDPKFCGDGYKAAQILREGKREDMEMVTLPFHPGLTIIRKSKKQLNWE